MLSVTMSVPQKPREINAYITQRYLSLRFVNSLVTPFTVRRESKPVLFPFPPDAVE